MTPKLTLKIDPPYLLRKDENCFLVVVTIAIGVIWKGRIKGIMTGKFFF